jgi:antitoxin component of MazEF toxin-antitoxin module
MSTKLKEFASQAHLCAVGNSKGYIFRHNLLAEAGVKPSEAFRVLIADRKIIFEYPKLPNASTVVPRPLSFYLKQRVKGTEPAVVDEIWSDDAPRGKERLV